MAQRAMSWNVAHFDIDPNEPVYVIGVVSQLIRIPVWTLRILDREGIVKAKRREGKWRLYSYNDLKRLVMVRDLLVEQGVNIHGIRLILRMERRTEYG